MPQAVSDFLSNANEQIEQAAKAVGRSIVTRKVFDAIYTGKQKIKTVEELARSTRLTRKNVLTAGKRLHNRHIVHQTKKDDDTAYEKIDSFYANKKKILVLAGDSKKLANLPTKRNSSSVVTRLFRVAEKLAKTQQITIDDIDSFKRVRAISVDSHLPKSVSEKKFKHGIRKILKEPGKFTDWGGERNDLYTTRVRFNNKRKSAAFAFKGPGTSGTLVPGKMGKNGDQIQRLFQSTAEVFFVQYWREIDESVVEQMTAFATAKSLATGKKIYFGIIDGVDSHRLLSAYPAMFED